jgi:hypothetical protein
MHAPPHSIRAQRTATRGAALAGSLLLLGAAADAARANSMRCGNDLVTRGDTQIQVLADCGQPDAIERLPSLLVPGTTIYGNQIYAGPFGTGLAGVSVELWTYNFGPRRLMRQVRLESGSVTEITTLGYGF